MSKKGRRWARRTFHEAVIGALPDRAGIGKLASTLGVALATIQHWLEIGLKSTRIENRREVRRKDLLAFLASSGRIKKGRKQ